MDYKEAYKAVTGNQTRARNEAWANGWRINNEGYKVTMSNIKSGEVHVGYREGLKNGGYGKRVSWQ